MTTTLLERKIRKIEGDLEILKKAVRIKPDFSVDEKNWERVKSGVKEIRSARFRKLYGKK